MARLMPRGDVDKQKEVWEPAQKKTGKTALISCPVCGRIGSLSQHQIDADGKVTPSCVCPWAGCTFHEWIALQGWVP